MYMCVYIYVYIYIYIYVCMYVNMYYTHTYKHAHIHALMQAYITLVQPRQSECRSTNQINTQTHTHNLVYTCVLTGSTTRLRVSSTKWAAQVLFSAIGTCKITLKVFMHSFLPRWLPADICTSKCVNYAHITLYSRISVRAHTCVHAPIYANIRACTYMHMT
jgi:hypothetical protein